MSRRRYTRTVHAKSDEHIYVHRNRSNNTGNGGSGSDSIFNLIGLLFLLGLIITFWQILLVIFVIYQIHKHWDYISEKILPPFFAAVVAVSVASYRLTKILFTAGYRLSVKLFRLCKAQYASWCLSRQKKKMATGAIPVKETQESQGATSSPSPRGDGWDTIES